MSVFVNKDTKVIVQGITGHQQPSTPRLRWITAPTS